MSATPSNRPSSDGPDSTSDEAPEPLGPESIAWRIWGDLRFWTLGVPPLIALQLAHPMVGAGVGEHSVYKTDPFGRARRSMSYSVGVVYGGEGANSRGAELRAFHKDIRGVDRHGVRYHAFNPEAYFFVHATGYWGMVECHQSLFGRALTIDEQSQLYTEWLVVGRQWGLRNQDMPATVDEFQVWWDHMLAERIEATPALGDYIEGLVHVAAPRLVPKPLWWPFAFIGGKLVRLMTLGPLPEETRRNLGLSWTPSDARKYRLLRRAARVSLSLLPDRLRLLPQAYDAYRTTQADSVTP